MPRITMPHPTRFVLPCRCYRLQPLRTLFSNAKPESYSLLRRKTRFVALPASPSEPISTFL